MKVIMVDASVGNDYSVCLCNSLSGKGIDVTLVVPENKELTMPHYFKVLKLSPSKAANRSRLRKFISYLDYFRNLFRLTSGNNKIVHYQFFRRRDEIFFYLFLKLTGRKLYHTAHNVLPHNAKKYDFLLQKIVYKSSKGIIAHSNFIRNKIITDFNINPAKLRVIPHGNFDFYRPQEKLTKEDARRHFGLQDEDKVLLFFGGIREYKGLDTLLEAFRIIKDEDHYKLLIAGAPQDKQSASKYEKLIRQITTNGKILYNFSFIPNDDVARYFISSDVLILPYKNIYHSGLVHLAYSFGKPIIAARVGDFEEVIDQDKSGLLLDENTAEDLACKIRMFFSNENRDQMENYVLNLNTGKYSWDTISEETINYYEMSC
jgi:glycosyltransferase involved in cell wall biosynthesis